MSTFFWADEQHLADITSLWNEGFPEDSAEDIDRFLRAVKGEARCLLMQAEGEICSMAFAIPAAVEGRDVWYVYAAATARKHRGKGFFGRLCEELWRRAQDEGAHGLFLRPGEPSLYAYYARLGFVPRFCRRRFMCKVDSLSIDAEDVVWETVTACFSARRKQWLARCGVTAVDWSESVTVYAVSLLQNGGMLVSDKGLVMYEQHGDSLVITELLCAAEDVDAVLGSLTRRFACQCIWASLPPCKEEEGELYGVFRAVMDWPEPNDAWYMGFSLE